MPDWQWATIKQQKVFQDSNSSDASNFSPTAAAKQHLGYSNSSFVFDESWSSFNFVDGGKLDYMWRDKLKDSPSQYAALMSDDKLLHNQKPQIHVTKGSYFGPQHPEARNNSISDHSKTVEDRSSKTTTTSWRTAGSEELAALVARRSGDYVANCDLPPSSEPTVTNIKQCNSISNNSSSSSSSSSKSAGTELLGEALCRSQTRAREAEKLALRAFQEKDELMQLFFKEASVSFAYRQWLILLQAENMCLKMCQEAYATWASSSSNLFQGRLKLNRKRKRNGPPVHRRRRSHVLLRCTLAFALGLGLAGAGLMLGWGMGWIFLAL